MKAGVTGHQHFDDPSVIPWIESCMLAKLRGVSGLVGLSSLAKGADQLFASVILQLGGSVEAVLPFAEYEHIFDKPTDAQAYKDLLARCAVVTTLEFAGTREESYFAAGKCIADNCDLVIAVWNGKPSAGLGGTADVVSYARWIGKPVYHINPLTRSASEMT